MRTHLKTAGKFALLAAAGFIAGDLAIAVYDGKIQFNGARASVSGEERVAWCPAEEKEVFFVSCSGFF